ncbi:MAG: hypothetical protein F6K19_50635 [Cyanothece sp. SIO1E1]|nr:hypothetical protein [Cyanothece sp. SIO1E1]
MKTKLLALGFSMAFLLGNAVYGELEEDPKGPIHQLQPFVVFPHEVKLLNDQKLASVDYDKIIRKDVERIVETNRREQLRIVIASYLEAFLDVTLVAAAE